MMLGKVFSMQEYANANGSYVKKHSHNIQDGTLRSIRMGKSETIINYLTDLFLEIIDSSVKKNCIHIPCTRFGN